MNVLKSHEGRDPNASVGFVLDRGRHPIRDCRDHSSVNSGAPAWADGGRIVNVSSALTRVAVPGSGPYASAKAAVEALTRYQALEFASRGITANVVAPGAVPTDFGNGHLRSDKTLQDFVVQGTALALLAAPEDIGELIAGLTTASGDWVTGQRIEASGGIRL